MNTMNSLNFIIGFILYILAIEFERINKTDYKDSGFLVTTLRKLIHMGIRTMIKCIGIRSFRNS